MSHANPRFDHLVTEEMPTQIERLEGLASHLLDDFLALRERYAFLEPMLFDRNVEARRGSGKQARGFFTLRHSLFLACVQDIAKLATDAYPKTPSIRNITLSLKGEQPLLKSLKVRFATWHLPSIECESDLEIVEALRQIELREQTERMTQFDKLHQELIALHDGLGAAPIISAFRTIRDKLTAHTEVRYIADKYQLVDINTLGIKWSDLKTTISEMQRAVELIGLIVRNAGFAWELLDRQLTASATAFWDASDAPI